MQFPTPAALPGFNRISRAWGLACLAALGVAVPGLASAGVADVLQTTVQTLSEKVTYAAVSKSGEPLLTYVGYQFRTSYGETKNTTNNVRLEGVIAATDPAERVALDSANSPSFCRTEPLAGAVKLICDIGQVRAGSPDIVFDVFFRAPQKVVNGVADAEGTDQLMLTGTTLYAEVSDGAGNTNNAIAWTGQTPVALGTISTAKIKSVLPKSGGKLSSGNGGAASRDDRFATSIVADNFSAFYSYIDTTLDETEIASCPDTILNDGICYELALTIVDGAGVKAEFYDVNRPIKPLSITLTIDGTASKGVNPARLTLTYDNVPVNLCPGKDVAFTDRPCLNGVPERVRDKKNPDIDGDIRVNVLNFRNGSFRIN